MSGIRRAAIFIALLVIAISVLRVWTFACSLFDHGMPQRTAVLIYKIVSGPGHVLPMACAAIALLMPVAQKRALAWAVLMVAGLCVGVATLEFSFVVQRYTQPEAVRMGAIAYLGSTVTLGNIAWAGMVVVPYLLYRLWWPVDRRGADTLASIRLARWAVIMIGLWAMAYGGVLRPIHLFNSIVSARGAAAHGGPFGFMHIALAASPLLHAVIITAVATITPPRPRAVCWMLRTVFVVRLAHCATCGLARVVLNEDVAAKLISTAGVVPCVVPVLAVMWYQWPLVRHGAKASTGLCPRCAFDTDGNTDLFFRWTMRSTGRNLNRRISYRFGCVRA